MAYTSTFYLLSTVPDFSVNVGGGNSAVMKITVKRGSVSKEVYNETLYADSEGDVSVKDMQSLLEPFFDGRQTIEVTCTSVTTSTSSSTFIVQYGNVEVNDYEYFARHHFLINYDTKRTCIGRVECLTMVDFGNTDIASVTCKAYYMNSATPRTFSIPAVKNTENSHTGYKVYDIDSSPKQFVYEGEIPYRYIIVCGERQIEYTLDTIHNDPYQVFLFKNCFNVWDAFYCNAVTETEVEIERSAAVINGYYRNYKVEEVRVLNCDTGVLMKEEKEWVLDLLRSRYIFLCKDGSGNYARWKEVSIIDSEAKSSNEMSDLTRFTFSCRMNQRQHNIIVEDDTFPQIFAKLFTSVYG